MVKKSFVIISFLHVLLLANLNNYAKANINIIAKVNDDIITSFDFEERVKFFTIINNLPASYSDEIKKEILNSLINDKIYLIAAKENKVKISKKEIEDKTEKIISENPKLAEYKNSLRKYIEANLSWINIIQKKFIQKININDSEIAKEKVKQVKDKQYLFRQVLFPANLFIGNLKDEILSIKDCNKLNSLLNKYNLPDSELMKFSSHELKDELKILFDKVTTNKTNAFVEQDYVYVFSLCKVINLSYTDEEIKHLMLELKMQELASSYLESLKKEVIIIEYNN